MKHGHALGSGKSPEYRCWRWVMARCYNRKSRNYPRYGARGIRVCPEWRRDFLAFFAHVGPRPSPQHSLDRFPDNDGNYEPGNVRWATAEEQARNRSTSKLTLESVAHIRRRLQAGEPQRAVARAFGVSHGLISHISTGRTWR